MPGKGVEKYTATWGKYYKPQVPSEQAIGKYEGRERHSWMCVASGNKAVFY